jgi:hypothetical protein
MTRSIYLINPGSDFPTYFNSESYGARGFARTVRVADLATPTLAAMCPPDFQPILCDQNTQQVDYTLDVDYVGITGNVNQFQHMVAVAAEFRRRGKVVVIGGPYATLSPTMVRPHCDILVTGEVEEMAPALFADLRSGRWVDRYEGGHPSLISSPVPRWDLYANDRAVTGNVQTSRGCPFECEFCDVIQYAGRKQRHKTPAQVTAELDALYRVGYRSVYLSDDNFTVYRSRAKELLAALATWNDRQANGWVGFQTQVSIDVAKDSEMLTMCADAGLGSVFIGLETPNEGSLREAKKRQNLQGDLVSQVHKCFEHGLHITAGMIVGFDSDGPDIFQRQYDFAMATGIPIFSLGALVAPPATPLHARMKASGRLRENDSEVAGVPWATNIVHPRLSPEAMASGIKWLANQLYAPDAFVERVLTFVRKFGASHHPRARAVARLDSRRSVDADTVCLVNQFRRLGPVEERAWGRLLAAMARNPPAARFVFVSVLQYLQIRHMYEMGQFWNPHLLEASDAQAKPIVTTM